MELKKVQDYYEELFKLYPDVPKRDIKRIMQFGLKSFLMHNNYGGDVLLQSPSMWLYCGKLMKDSVKYFEYYKRKMIIKLRINHRRLEIPWDGYYYFGLYQSQYDEYLKQRYGVDYMIPINMATTHGEVLLDVNNSYKKYMK